MKKYILSLLLVIFLSGCTGNLPDVDSSDSSFNLDEPAPSNAKHAEIEKVPVAKEKPAEVAPVKTMSTGEQRAVSEATAIYYKVKKNFYDVTKYDNFVIIDNDSIIDPNYLSTIPDNTLVVFNNNSISVKQNIGDRRVIAGDNYGVVEIENMGRNYPDGIALKGVALRFYKNKVFSYTNSSGSPITLYSLVNENLTQDQVDTLISMYNFYKKYRNPYTYYVGSGQMGMKGNNEGGNSSSAYPSYNSN